VGENDDDDDEDEDEDEDGNEDGKALTTNVASMMNINRLTVPRSFISWIFLLPDYLQCFRLVPQIK